MAVTAKWYQYGVYHVMNGDVDFTADTVKIALLDNTYTYADANQYWDSGGTGVGTDEVTGTGYTAGGITLANKAVTLVDSGSATAWAATTAYAVGDIVRKVADNGHIYRCISAGTSGGSEPAWSTATGVDVTDNTVTWEEAGSGFVKFDNTVEPEWTSSTITARYAVVYVTGTAGVADYVLGLIDFGQDESSSNGSFKITIHQDGLLQQLIGV